MLPNFASISAPMVHIWSIGVEEQFYALWPWIARKRVIVLTSVGILILKLALILIVPLLKIKGMMAILTNLRFECMALGALAAHAYFEKASILKWLYHRSVQILAWGACVYVIIGAVCTNFFYFTGFSLALLVFGCVFILNLAGCGFVISLARKPIFEAKRAAVNCTQQSLKRRRNPCAHFMSSLTPIGIANGIVPFSSFA